jgi:hypothetical protein
METPDHDCAEERLASLKPHEVKRLMKDQEEADENARLQKPAEVKKRRLAQQRHVQLKLVAGTRAGVYYVASFHVESACCNRQPSPGRSANIESC